MKLKVGMYVRDIHGRIDKIIGFEGALIEFEKDLICGYIDCNDFTKVSFNFIDILAVGDIIATNNLCGEITKIDKENDRIYTTSYDGEYCSSDDIKEVLTREQFKASSYRIGD